MEGSDIRSALLVFAALACLHCGGGDDDAAAAPRTPVQIDFAFEINGEPFACGAEYAGVGDPATDFRAVDARFYVHDVELIDASGAAHPLALEENAHQNDGLALLDFEDGCGPDGSPETNTLLSGSVASGDHRGIRFTLGVPPERNHIDLAAAKAPLDVTGMFWTWQNGFKFFKVDGSSPAQGGGINPFLLHVGSSGCSGENSSEPPPEPCALPNRVSYELDGFTPGQSTIIAELGELFATTDLAFNTDGTAPGCMSEPDDPECLTLLPRMGIDDAGSQLLFSVD